MNKKKHEPIHEFDLKLIADFFAGLDRQGPGSNEQTLRALQFIPDAGSVRRIADIGCGTGRQTAVLARHLGGTITAIDLLPEMIAGLRERMARAGLAEKVTGTVASMDDLRFEEESFDLIWAEGSIYNIGFERGLTAWRRFLRPGGTIAVTECSWLGSENLPVTQYIQDNFLDIDLISNKVRILEKTGYRPLAHFILPSACWTEHYLLPAAARIPHFLAEQGHTPTTERFARLLAEEAAHYDRYGSHYGYVFYIGQKPL
ncbi:class I SAM-dependent methyltransferase [Alistipes sp.]|uniref:class I SAM-dependent methyltransferase n=1 Tax=Alistipes sp. TaxID=1872444 RepID=UPI003AF0BFA9